MGCVHLRLVAPRTSFPSGATAEEGRATAGHDVRWQARADAGRAIAAGPVLDRNGPFGPARVENEAEAEALGAADPVIAAGPGFRYPASPVPSLILRTH